MSPTFLTLPDGARIAYELLGSEWSGHSEPIVFVGGVSSTREDWQRLAQPLSMKRPVLIYDHRGIGESSYSTASKDDDITIELMARDLLLLLQFLKFSQLALCGFSMGGAVTQQLLLLPYLASDPVTLPFKVTRVFLTGTFQTMWEEKGYGLKLDRTPITGPLTDEEKKARARPNLERSFDPEWVSDPANQDRFNWWLDRQIVGRPLHTIIKQSRATAQVAHMKLYGYEQIPKSTHFLIIHGEKDAIVPFSNAAKLLREIAQASFIQTGFEPGQIPTLAFGHHWWEYFDIEVWINIIETFLSSRENQRQSKL
ncbi:Alpha/Beta hydrolase protein [Lentinula boryana]|uniref:Alpha/Beta hydrolase protein n=1 Tax=Lentinula boryana TaxID=40481 RepID=A0ABQ8QJW1_9AGAR|nr:Alpha/Beta hydrolase protein [Lentinula boryana]